MYQLTQSRDDLHKDLEVEPAVSSAQYRRGQAGLLEVQRTLLEAEQVSTRHQSGPRREGRARSAKPWWRGELVRPMPRRHVRPLLPHGRLRPVRPRGLRGRHGPSGRGRLPELRGGAPTRRAPAPPPVPPARGGSTRRRLGLRLVPPAGTSLPRERRRPASARPAPRAFTRPTAPRGARAAPWRRRGGVWEPRLLRLRLLPAPAEPPGHRLRGLRRGPVRRPRRRRLHGLRRGHHRGRAVGPECAPCAPVRFQPSSLALLCLACGAGAAQASPGDNVCLPCVAGLAQPGTGAMSCAGCAAGQAQRGTGARAAPGAPPARTRRRGPVVHGVCAGGFLGRGASGCVAACPSGRYAAAARGCLTCPAGQFALSAGGAGARRARRAPGARSRRRGRRVVWPAWRGRPKVR